MTTTPTLVQKFAFALALGTFAACGQSPLTQEAATESGLTAVNIALPKKSELPESLAKVKLGYCFVAKGTTAVYDGKPDAQSKQDCESLGPVYSEAIRKAGEYTESVVIDAKLKKAEYQTLILKIGALKDDGKMDATKVFYGAATHVKPEEMKGKDKLTVVMRLERLADLPQLPPVIVTEAGEIDVDVKVEMPKDDSKPNAEPAKPSSEPGKPSEPNSKPNGKDDCGVPPTAVALKDC